MDVVIMSAGATSGAAGEAVHPQEQARSGLPGVGGVGGAQGGLGGPGHLPLAAAGGLPECRDRGGVFLPPHWIFLGD